MRPYKQKLIAQDNFMICAQNSNEFFFELLAISLSPFFDTRV
jgi:hypothetical protein